ncbi:MAG: hypothetical protein H6782_02440 [Candidatus Nomurabacteria bacterium]|nr:MAG: hypothetical protein H6782_02440 [Candidatus Nomurabacteria bacterium]
MDAKRVKTVWRSVVKRIPAEYVTETRERLNIPPKGFLTFKDQEKWYQNALKEVTAMSRGAYKGKRLTERQRIVLNKALEKTDYGILQQAISTIVEKFPVLKGYEDAVREGLLGLMNEKSINSGDYTGCEFAYVTKDSGDTDLSEGLYIRVSSHTTKQDIDDFLTKKKTAFQKLKKLLYPDEPIRYQVSPAAERKEMTRILRDHSLVELNKLCKKECEERGDYDPILPTRKDMAIERLLKFWGYKK